MSIELDDLFFDLTFKVLNYAIEFAGKPGYASVRMMDVLRQLIELSDEIEGVNKNKFYGKVKEKIEDKKRMTGMDERVQFLNEILVMFVDEWKKPI
jgi:hypothetical protein